MQAENDLERALVRASQDPACRPDFYRVFLQSTLFVIQDGPPPAPGGGEAVLPEGYQLQIRTLVEDGKRYLPIFSSTSRMRAVTGEEVRFLGLAAPELLQITLGADLFLNPGSQYRKTFTKEEVASLLDGSIWKPTHTHVAGRDERVLIGQPKNYPKALVDALSRLFATKPTVERAFLAHYHNPKVDPAAHSLVAVEATGNWEEILAEAGLVARDVPVPDPPVDFLRLTGEGGGVEAYFRGQCPPFYVRAGRP